MPRLEPFVGLRYAPSLPLEKLIAPPYDVVSPTQRAQLAERHRANAIHVELPEDDRAAGLDRYQAAAHLLAQWQEGDLLRAEKRPGLYGYRMTDRRGRSTTGVVGALGCEPEDGDVLPHEQTMAKDTTDRLELLRATGANLSPIWGLSLADGLTRRLDPTLALAFEAPGARREGVARSVAASATDDEGVRHDLWVIDEPDEVAALAGVVASAPVVLADGHHRYQTAREYQHEQRSAHDGRSGGYDLVMALVVELAPDQVRVGPIHRTLSGVDPDEVVERFGRWFDMVHAGPPDDTVLAAIAQSVALALVSRQGVWLLTPKADATEVAESDLDSSLVALAAGDLPSAEIAYHHRWNEAARAVAGGRADVAVLLRPVTVDQITEWAHARRRMPPKSTYFFPKPRTGMVFRPLAS